jgi:hypothetical protein
MNIFSKSPFYAAMLVFILPISIGLLTSIFWGTKISFFVLALFFAGTLYNFYRVGIKSRAVTDQTPTKE